MRTKRFFVSFFRKEFILAALVLMSVILIVSACNLPVNEVAEREGQEEPVDPNAQLYRIYYDSSADEDENELQIRKFMGQIWMADVEAYFGNLDELPRDEHENYVCGPVLDETTVWSLIANPSQVGIILITRNLEDDTVSSALDLDGDRVADIVDYRLGDGRRISFVTELLGMGVFEDWLLGRNPLCGTGISQQEGFEGFAFGCPDEEDGGGEEGSFGGSGGPSAGSGHVDPLDQLCADYNNSPGFGMNRGLVGQATPRGQIRYGYSRLFVNEDASSSNLVTAIYEDADGNWTGTTKIINEYDSSSRLVRTITETVSPDGSGERTITIPARRNDDGSVTLPGTKHQSFEAHPDATGDYNGSESDPPTPGTNTDSAGSTSGGSSESPPDEEPAPDPPPEGDTGDPGPDGDDTSLRELCERRGTPSGVEQAAATDPTAFQVSCGDLVGAPSGGDDCTIIDWAGTGDFRGALEPSGNNCGPFEEPDADGNCTKSGMQMMRDNIARIASLNLPGVVICPPILCQPGLFDQAEPGLLDQAADSRQETSSTDMTPFQCVAPVQTLDISSDGEILDLLLCNRGPGPGYKTVSSLKAGDIVEILGLGAEDGWLVVDNPIYPGEACWVPEGDVEVDPQLDLGSLPLFGIPDLTGNGSEGGVCTLNAGICGNQGKNFNSANCTCE